MCKIKKQNIGLRKPGTNSVSESEQGNHFSQTHCASGHRTSRWWASKQWASQKSTGSGNNQISRAAALLSVLMLGLFGLSLFGAAHAQGKASQAHIALTDGPRSEKLPLRNQRLCNWPDATTLGAILPVAGEDGSYASGVVFDRNKVLTAAHALDSSFRVFVSIDNEFRLARILRIDREHDLAILSVDTGAILPLQIASTMLAKHQAVWAVGFPRAQAKETSSGVFTKESHGALHTSAPIDLGQSGGGLLQCTNGSYQLAGMLRGYGAYVQGDQFIKLENHSVSVAASTIQEFIDTSSLSASSRHSLLLQ